jgi:hypothetical protein
MVAASSRGRTAAAFQGIRSKGISRVLGRRELRELVLGRVPNGVGRAMPREGKEDERHDGGYLRRLFSRLVVQLWFARSEE